MHARWAALLLLTAGCPHRTPPLDPLVVAEVRPITGEVRVVPGIGVFEAPGVELDDFMGQGLTEPRVAIRSARTKELTRLPEEVGLALPGAVGGQLADGFQGTFRAAGWPEPVRARVERAIERGHGLDRALAAVGRSVGGEAVLVSWVDRMEAQPLSLRGAPGDMVTTPQGAVVIDHDDEPYLVDLGVGVALVGSDGVVLLRFREDVQTILSGGRPPAAVGREVARHVAEEVARVWSRP